MSGKQTAVILASAGRPEILADAIAYVDALKESVPSHKIVSVPDAASLPSDGVNSTWMVVEGTRGLAAQRNSALRALPPGVEIAFFFDDDAIIRSDYIAHAVRLFDRQPNLAGLTGVVLADGKISGEIAKSAGESIVHESRATAVNGRWVKTRELYGANFAIRWDQSDPIWFDERLPLYSWLEDHDYARRLLLRGSLAKAHDCIIVHRAAASGGRSSHLRLGYSQVMNPSYLFTKGSFPLWLTVQQMSRVVAKNFVFSIFPGASRSWRRSRLRGNILAASDILRGRVWPERIIDL